MPISINSGATVESCVAKRINFVGPSPEVWASILCAIFERRGCVARVAVAVYLVAIAQSVALRSSSLITSSIHSSGPQGGG